MPVFKKVIFIKLCTIALFCFIVFPLKAQQGWDSTYRPDIYYPRVHLFRTLPAGKKDIVFIGDSITFWGDWTELLGNRKVKNRGIPGDTSFGLLERIGEAVKDRPTAVLIMIGINDLARGVPTNVILDNYKRIADTIRLHSPVTKVYIQSILPVNETAGKLQSHYKRAGEIPGINRQLSQWAKENRLEYIDLFTTLSDREGRLRSAYTWDGIHLTIEGYRAWQTVLQSKKIGI
ncbi:MAG: GDSL-type esterase/lipase family protein [Agriterribacter sp.]